MKTEDQIKAKIQEHEDHITVLLEADRSEWTNIDVMCIESYLVGRKALLWTLAGGLLEDSDDFEKHARYECLCFESCQIY